MPYIFILTLVAVTAAYIYRKTALPDRKFLVLVFIIGMVLRSYISVFLTNMHYLHAFFLGGEGFIAGDERLYTITAMDIARSLSDKTFVYKMSEFGYNLYTYILSIFYAVFGYKLIASKLINCYIGAVIPITVYYITLRLSASPLAGRISALICCLYPSFILWSIGNLKEPLIIVSVLIGFYLLIKTVSLELRVKDLMAILLYSIMVINLQLIYLSQIIILFFIMILRYCHRIIGIISSAALVIMAMIYMVKEQLFLKLIGASALHQWQMMAAGKSGYYLYPDSLIDGISKGQFDFVALLWVYVKGLLYFLFSPFPWQVNSITHIVTMPQVLIWYVLCIFAMIGLARLYKIKPIHAVASVIFLLIPLSIWAITEGNVGAAFRHRDHLAAVIFIFSGIGIAYIIDRYHD